MPTTIHYFYSRMQCHHRFSHAWKHGALTATVCLFHWKIATSLHIVYDGVKHGVHYHEIPESLDVCNSEVSALWVVIGFSLRRWCTNITDLDVSTDLLVEVAQLPFALLLIARAHLQLQGDGHSQLCHFLKLTVHCANQKFVIEKFIMWMIHLKVLTLNKTKLNFVKSILIWFNMPNCLIIIVINSARF